MIEKYGKQRLDNIRNMWWDISWKVWERRPNAGDPMQASGAKDESDAARAEEVTYVGTVTFDERIQQEFNDANVLDLT